MRPRMSMITLGVDDIERAIAFYRRAGAEMSAKVRFTLLATQR